MADALKLISFQTGLEILGNRGKPIIESYHNLRNDAPSITQEKHNR